MTRPLGLLLLLAGGARGMADAEAEGSGRWERLFNGRSLKGWATPDSSYWSVSRGAIVARSTPAHPCTHNQFLVWQGGPVGDFILRLRFRIEGPPNANSGIQLRSRVREDGHAVGYQADIDREGRYLGALYDEEGRGMLAERGRFTLISPEGIRTSAPLAEPGALLAAFRPEDWNTYEIRAEGPRLQLQVQGRTTAEVLDLQQGEADAEGVLALQLHSGPPTTVRFRDIELKRLPR